MCKGFDAVAVAAAVDKDIAAVVDKEAAVAVDKDFVEAL